MSEFLTFTLLIFTPSHRGGGASEQLCGA